MKKTNMFGCALVVLALVFAACPTGGGGGGGDVPLQPEQSTAPAAPAVPVLTPGDAQITATWRAVAGATAYEVRYGTTSDSASATKYGTDVTGTTKTITGLTNGTTYYVWIKAKNIIGTSGFSPSANGTPALPISAPTAPGAPTLTPGNAQITVTWNPVAGASAYEVWYGTGNNSASATKYGDDVTGTTKTISGLTNGNTYYVWIKAKNIIGTSGFSPSASASPDVFTTPARYREMAGLEGGTITGAGVTGAFVSDRNIILSDFNMAKHETTYELWKEVYDWAVTNGYTFANAGVEGHGTDGTGTEGDTALKKSRPVTNINWRDAVVWCNAYSELSGKTPVYYSGGAVLKDSQDVNATACDAAEMDTTKNGYRLPTEVEWEYAARGGDRGAGSWGYTYAGSNDIGAVAWYKENARDVTSTDPAYGAHPVGTKTANSAGLYDMTGNVFEWCWDWFELPITSSTPIHGPPADTGRGRGIRSGSWYNETSSCAVYSRGNEPPGNETSMVGFRVVSCP